MLSPNELTRILEIDEQVRRRQERAALVTVVSISGSAYRRPGARMFIAEDGRATGGVSGGCLEADVVRRARAAIEDGQPTLVLYDATDDEEGSFGAGLGCRGVIEVLIEPTWLERTRFHLTCLARMVSSRHAGVLALRLHGKGSEIGAFALALASGEEVRFEKDGSDEALSFIRDRVPLVMERRRGCCVSGVLLDYLRPLPRLLVVGGGPDSEPLVACAHALGYRITVLDERPGHLSRRRYPRETRTIITPLEKLAPHELADSETACIIATHNVAYDLRALRKLMPDACGYIGLLGPRSRAVRLLSQLRAELPAGSVGWDRIHAPIGLDIGSDTPEQIALAVLAELQAVMAGRPGGPLRDGSTPIHHDSSDQAAAGELR